MAKGRKTGGRDIKPGQILNPKGGPKKSDEQARLEAMNKIDWARSMRYVFSHHPEDIMLLASGGTADPIALLAATIYASAIEHADDRKAEWLAMRTVGKVKDNLEVTHREPDVIQYESEKIIMPFKDGTE